MQCPCRADRQVEHSVKSGLGSSSGRPRRRIAVALAPLCSSALSISLIARCSSVLQTVHTTGLLCFNSFHTIEPTEPHHFHFHFGALTLSLSFWLFLSSSSANLYLVNLVSEPFLLYCLLHSPLPTVTLGQRSSDPSIHSCGHVNRCESLCIQGWAAIDAATRPVNTGTVLQCPQCAPIELSNCPR